MKNVLIKLMILLVFGTVSAQVNKVDPPAAIPSPGSPPTENATQKINREQARQNAKATLSPPSVTASTAVPVQSAQRATPVTNNTMTYPAGTLAYPVPQGATQPGTCLSTGEASGTNNPLTTLPTSNTSNQGRVP